MKPVLALALALPLLAGCVAPPPKVSGRPVEYPPFSYRGSTYVDSAGCAFVRAGDADTVVWVPQVQPDHSGVCGFRPSLPPAVVAPPGPPAARP